MGNLARVPFGDAVLVFGLEIPGLAPVDFILHWGVERDTTPEDRIKGTRPPYQTPPTKVGSIMDLRADKKRSVQATGADEVGNPVPLPEGTVVTYTVDDPALVNLTDNGDGSAVVAATGTLGSTILRVTGTLNGQTATKEELIAVIAGNAERFGDFTFGDEEEVTPDEAPTP